MAKYYSFAQFKEDVVLMRAINHVSHEVGFYIDVGANDPEHESVTKVFYDHGWRGINIDASQGWVKRLQIARTRDINIHAAVTDRSGQITFYEQPNGGLGTTVSSIAEMHRKESDQFQAHERTVPALTLTEICEQHAPIDIHFLKVDVEGGEGAVLRGMDFRRFRPWVLCIECHLPNHPEVQLYEEWEPLLIEAGYQVVYTDVFNRFYLSQDHSELLDCFSIPIDDYAVYADVREINQLKQERDSLKHEISQLRDCLSAVTNDLDHSKQRLARLDAKKGVLNTAAKRLGLRQ